MNPLQHCSAWVVCLEVYCSSPACLQFLPSYARHPNEDSPQWRTGWLRPERGWASVNCKVTLFFMGEGDWCSQQWGSLWGFVLYLWCPDCLKSSSILSVIPSLFHSAMVDKKLLYVFYGCRSCYKPPPSLVNSSTPQPHVGLQLEQTARGTHKRSPSAYREEGYRVTMETDSPTPVADGGGEGIGGWV